MAAVRTIYRYWAAILLLAMLVQVFLAGFGAFDVTSTATEGSATEDDVSDAFDPHAIVGSLIVPGSLLLFLLSLGARLGRTRVLLSLAVFLDAVVQMILAWIGEEVSVIGGFHPINALVLISLTGYIVWGAFRRWTDLGATVGEPRAGAV